MFRSSTIVRELVLSLAKVMFKHLCRSDVYVNFSVKLNLTKFNKQCICW
jgi:hypothetical protein